MHIEKMLQGATEGEVHEMEKKQLEWD